MIINYSLNHDILKLPVFTEEKLTTTEHLVTWIVLCQIAHFTQNAGNCRLNKNEMTKDLGCHHTFLKKATDLLTKYDMIKEIVPSRKALHLPAVYVTTKSYVTGCKKVCHRVTKAMSQGDQDNNNNYYKQNNDGFNKPHDSSMANPHKIGTIAWVEAEELKLKLKQ